MGTKISYPASNTRESVVTSLLATALCTWRLFSGLPTQAQT